MSSKAGGIAGCVARGDLQRRLTGQALELLLAQSATGSVASSELGDVRTPHSSRASRSLARIRRRRPASPRRATALAVALGTRSIRSASHGPVASAITSLVRAGRRADGEGDASRARTPRRRSDSTSPEPSHRCICAWRATGQARRSRRRRNRAAGRVLASPRLRVSFASTGS